MICRQVHVLKIGKLYVRMMVQDCINKIYKEQSLETCVLCVG